MRKSVSLFLVLFALVFTASAQLRKIPSEVTDAFQAKYPTARNVEFTDMLATIHVHFVLDSARMTAKYNPNGFWKETEKEWSFDRLGKEIQEGFEKSKYATDWKIKEATIIYLPGGEQYRIKVEKNNLKKKYLFFDKKGRLLRDSLTI
jgi:hypothetical protein